MSEDVDKKLAKPALPTEPIDQAMKLSLCSRENVTYYTLEADADEAKSHMRAFGTKNPDFFFGLLQQIVNAGSKGQYPDEQGIKFMLGFIKESKPRDEIQAALSAQIAACQVATMRYANRLAHAESLQEQDSAERTFNKLARTFAALVEALQRYRACSEENVVVQHVAIGTEGQAIVENGKPRARRAVSKEHNRAPPKLAAAGQFAIKTVGKPQHAPVLLRRRQKR